MGMYLLINRANSSKQLNRSQKSVQKKVVSDSPWLVNSVFKFFLRNSNNRRTVKSILLVKKFWGLVEMTSGLTNASFSLQK